MEPGKSVALETQGLGRRIVAEHRGLVHGTAAQPDALAILQVDRGKQNHVIGSKR